MKITQSFMNTMQDYLHNGECGNIVKHQYADGKLLELDSDSIALGTYFEYILTGALPKNKQVPVPEYSATALKNKKPQDLTVKDMSQAYRVCHANAARVKSLLADMGLEVVTAGIKLTKGRFEGTIDIIAKVIKAVDGFTWNEGDEIVIDVKYSALIYDKWAKFGWMWSDIQKDYHGRQAKQYHYITGRPFYFLVVSSVSTNMENPDGSVKDCDVRFFHTPIDEMMLAQHIGLGNDLLNKFQYHLELGFEPRPSLSKCAKCPLKENCADKHTYPRPEIVDLTLGI